MAAFVPAVTLSMALAIFFHDRRGTVQVVLGIVLAAYLLSFLASRILEKSDRRLPKTYDLGTEAECQHARDMMRTLCEPVFWLAIFLVALGASLIPFAAGADRPALAGVLVTGAVLGGISGWAWWRTTITFMQFLRDFRTWARDKAEKSEQKRTEDDENR